MAGTLTISTLSDGTNSTSSTNCIQGSAKAWVNYKGTATRAINASYNVSSVTFISTGTYQVNLTTAMADANYAVVCEAGSAANDQGSTIGIASAGIGSSSSFYLRVTQSGSLTDYVQISAAVFR
jgi:hypothetical protein